ncbi:MAG: TIM barrel protein [Planctomycetota bacterium]
MKTLETLQLEGNKIVDEKGDAWATWRGDLNLLGQHGLGDLPASRVILWTGWSGDEPFERHPLTWGPASLDQFRKAIDAASRAAAETGTTLLLRPHARHVLADPQRCLSFFRERADSDRVGLVLDTASMLEASMVEKVEDHLERAVDALAEHAAAVWLSDVQTSDTLDALGEPELRRVAPGEGAMGEHLLGTVDRCVPADVPRIVG